MERRSGGLRVIHRGEHDDRKVAVARDRSFGDLDPVDAGHKDVAQEDGEVIPFEGGDSFGAVSGNVDGIAAPAEISREAVPQRLLVVDDEDVCSGRFSVGRDAQESQRAQVLRRRGPSSRGRRSRPDRRSTCGATCGR